MSPGRVLCFNLSVVDAFLEWVTPAKEASNAPRVGEVLHRCGMGDGFYQASMGNVFMAWSSLQRRHTRILNIIYVFSYLGKLLVVASIGQSAPGVGHPAK